MKSKWKWMQWGMLWKMSPVSVADSCQMKQVTNLWRLSRSWRSLPISSESNIANGKHQSLHRSAPTAERRPAAWWWLNAAFFVPTDLLHPLITQKYKSSADSCEAPKDQERLMCGFLSRSLAIKFQFRKNRTGLPFSMASGSLDGSKQIGGRQLIDGRQQMWLLNLRCKNDLSSATLQASLGFECMFVRCQWCTIQKS